MFRPATNSRIDQIWDEQKRQLMLRFTTITENDLQFETGRKYEMIDRLGVKLGKSDTEMKNIFQSL